MWQKSSKQISIRWDIDKLYQNLAKGSIFEDKRIFATTHKWNCRDFLFPFRIYKGQVWIN